MTSSTKWDFSPLQPFPWDMPTISLTPPGTKKRQQFLTNWNIIFFSLPSEKWLYLGKKIMNMTRSESCLCQEGQQIKYWWEYTEIVFYFLQMCFSLLFIWACHSMEEEEGGGTIVIQLLNLKFNLWTPLQRSDSRELFFSFFFFLQNKAIKTKHGWNYCGVKPAKLLFWAQSTTFLCRKNDFTPSRFNVLSC